MGNQPPQRARAEVEPSGTIKVTRDLLSSLDGQPVPPAAVTEAERRRYSEAYEELKERYDSLNLLLNTAHETGFTLGVESSRAAAPRDHSALIKDLQGDLDRMSSLAQNNLRVETESLAAKMENSPRFKSATACEMEENHVLQCLQSEPNQSLNCHALVSAYAECATRARRSAFDSLS